MKRKKSIIAVICMLTIISLVAMLFVGCKDKAAKDGAAYINLTMGRSDASSSSSTSALAKSGEGSGSSQDYDGKASVEIVVNLKGSVTAVNGADQDGKIIISKEVVASVKGKSVGEAVEIIANAAIETGYIAKNDANGSYEASLDYALSADVKALDGFAAEAKTKFNAKCKEKGLELQISKLAKISVDEIVEANLYTSAGLYTQEELKAMSQAELVLLLGKGVDEKSTKASKYEEESYFNAKATAIFKSRLKIYKENSTSVVLRAYINALEIAINALEVAETEFANITKEHMAEFDKAYVTLVEAEQKILKANPDLTEEEKAVLKAQFEEAKAGLNLARSNYQSAIDVVSNTLKSAKNTVIEELNKVKANAGEEAKKIEQNENAKMNQYRNGEVSIEVSASFDASQESNRMLAIRAEIVVAVK